MVDGAEEALVAKTTAVAEAIIEIAQSLNIRLEKNERWLSFQTHHYQKRTSSHSIQENIDALPVLYVDKNYIYIDDIICMGPIYLKLLS